MNKLTVITYVTIITFTTILDLPSSAFHQSNSCQIKAFVLDQDSTGLNVRKNPNSRSQVVGKLPTNTEVQVLQVQGNWMLISPISPKTQNVEFQGKGWVSRALLGLGTRGYDKTTVPIYSQASWNSRIIGSIPSTKSVKLLSCKGSWAQVEKNGLRGWLPSRYQCAASRTSCS
jgi:uncharacterized protein YgiM (DUF1202 family)